MPLLATMPYGIPYNPNSPDLQSPKAQSKPKAKPKSIAKVRPKNGSKSASRRSSFSVQPYASPSRNFLFPYQEGPGVDMPGFDEIHETVLNNPPKTDPLGTSAKFLPQTPVQSHRSSSFSEGPLGISPVIPSVPVDHPSKYNTPILNQGGFQNLHVSHQLHNHPDVPPINTHDFPFHPALLNFSPQGPSHMGPSPLDMLHNTDPFDESPLMPPTARFSAVPENSMSSSLGPSLGPQLASPLGPSFAPNTPPPMSLSGGLGLDLSPSLAPAANSTLQQPIHENAYHHSTIPHQPELEQRFYQCQPLPDNFDAQTTADTIPGETSPSSPSQEFALDNFYHDHPQNAAPSVAPHVPQEDVKVENSSLENSFSLDEFLRDEPYTSLAKHTFNINLESINKPKLLSQFSQPLPAKLPKARHSSTPRSAPASGAFTKLNSGRAIPKSSSFSTAYRRSFTPSSEPSFSFEDCSNEFHVGEGNYSFQDETARLSMQLGPALNLKKKQQFRSLKPQAKSVLKKSRTLSNICLTASHSSSSLPPAPRTLKNMESGLVSFQLNLNSQR